MTNFNDVKSKYDIIFTGALFYKDGRSRGRRKIHKEDKKNQRTPLSSKSGLFIIQPSEKENKHGLGQEIELEAREEGIEISQCSLTKLLCPKKSICPQEPVCGMGRLILAWLEKAVGPTIADWFQILPCRVKSYCAYLQCHALRITYTRAHTN